MTRDSTLPLLSPGFHARVAVDLANVCNSLFVAMGGDALRDSWTQTPPNIATTQSTTGTAVFVVMHRTLADGVTEQKEFVATYDAQERFVDFVVRSTVRNVPAGAGDDDEIPDLE